MPRCAIALGVLLQPEVEAMLDRDALDKVVRPLLARLGVRAPSFHDQQEVVVRVRWQGATFDLRFLASEPNQCLYVTAAVASTNDPEWLVDVAPALLSASAFGVGTAGFALSWSPGDHTLYLGHALFVPGITAELADTTVARLMSAVLHWRRELGARFGERLVTEPAT